MQSKSIKTVQSTCQYIQEQSFISHYVLALSIGKQSNRSSFHFPEEYLSISVGLLLFYLKFGCCSALIPLIESTRN